MRLGPYLEAELAIGADYHAPAPEKVNQYCFRFWFCGRPRFSTALKAHGAIHEETARQMAQGVRRAGRSDWGISTTGIAGPTGGTDDKPVGTVCVGVAGPLGASARRFVLDIGSRERSKQLFAATALEMLRRELEPGT